MQLPDWFIILHSFETFMQVKVRTTYDQHVRRKKKKPPPEVRSRDGHVENVFKLSGSIKNGVDMRIFVGKTCVLHVVACNYLVLV